MAKRCEVCKRTYSDKEPTCPYCAEAVDLSAEGSEDASGIEVVDDSGVQIEAPPGKGTPSPARKEGKKTHTEGKKTKTPDLAAGGEPKTGPQAVGSPTQLAPKTGQPTHLASRSGAPTMLAPPGAEDEILDAVPDEPGDAGKKPPAKPQSPKKTQMGGKAAQPTQLASKSTPPTMLAPSDEDAGEATATPQAKSRTPRGPKKETDVHTELDEGESVDLGATPPGAPKPKTHAKSAPATEPMDLLGQDMLVEGSSEVNLGGAPSGKSERPSGLDLIAEAVESGEDLDKPHKPVGDVSEEETAAALADESSAVNLGEGAAVRNPFAEGEADEAAGKPPKRQAAEAEEEVGIVDEEEEAAAEEELVAAGGPTKPSRPATGKYWLGGIGIGLLIAIVGIAGASFAGLVKLGGGKDEAGGPRKADPALAQARQDKEKAEADLAAARNEAKQLADAAKKDKDNFQKQLKSAQQERKKAEDAAKANNAQVAQLKKDLGDANDLAAKRKTDNDNLTKTLKERDDALKTAKDDLTAAKKAADSLAKDKANLTKDRQRLTALVTGIRKKLREGKHLGDNADTDELLLAGLDKALGQAVSPLATVMGHLAGSLGSAGGGLAETFGKVYDLGGLITRREAALAYYKSREPLVRSPQQMLDYWITLLQERDRKDTADVAKKAARDARFVAGQDLFASPAAKSKAQFVLALAERNQLNFAEAKAHLQQALAGPEDPADATWRTEAKALKADLDDSLAYQRRYETLKASGHLDQLLAEITAGVKVAAGKNKGSLLALSSLVRLDMALKANRKLKANSPGVAEARKEAHEAIAAGADAEGNYSQGRIAEELGDLAAAARHYSVAAKYQGRKDLASLYRLALARVLLKTQAPAPQEKKPTRPAEKTQAQPRREQGRVALSRREVAAPSPLALLLLMNAVLLSEDGEEDATSMVNPNVDRAIELAKEAIDLGDPRGHLLLGIALTQKGEWTKGLNEYLTGLEILCPGDATRGLRTLIEEHPALHTPDSVKPPQPLLAEKHFSLGLDYFFAHQYPKAETEFAEAIRFFGNDARYHYYLGLSRLLQNASSKVGAAIESFRQGKRLEDQGNPDRADVDASLEKVQGQPRQVLSRYRKP
jgi:hypothetical protein